MTKQLLDVCSNCCSNEYRRFVLFSQIQAGIFFAVLMALTFHLSQGAEFSKGDIIFIAVVIGACVVAIIITIICHLACRRRGSKGDSGSLLSSICCWYDNNVNSRFKVVSKRWDSDCAICLEEKNMMKKPVVEITCKHTYHQACISKCLEMDKRAKCPQCRRLPGTYSTGERFVAVIQAIIQKRRERTLTIKASEKVPLEEEKINTEIEVPECSVHIPPIPPEAVV